MAVERETRRYPRRNTHKAMLVVWKKESQKYVSRVENLGLGGLFICTQHPPPEGTSLQLLFNVPEGEVRGRAIVRNQSPGRGMGLAIVSMEQVDFMQSRPRKQAKDVLRQQLFDTANKFENDGDRIAQILTFIEVPATAQLGLKLKDEYASDEGQADRLDKIATLLDSSK